MKSLGIGEWLRSVGLWRTIVGTPDIATMTDPDLSKVPPELREHTRKLIANQPGLGIAHGIKPISTKYPPQVDRFLRGLPSRSQWIRDAVQQRIEREGIDLGE